MATYSLEEGYQKLLDEIAWRNRTNKTEMLRQLIDAAAALQDGVEPIGEADPKLFVPVP